MAPSGDPTSSRSEQAKSLRDALATSLQFSVFPDSTNIHFIPNGTVDTLVTPASVANELFPINPAERLTPSKREVDQALVNYVAASAKKLLIISILNNPSCGLRAAMEAFKTHQFGDDDLPVIEAENQFPPCFYQWDLLSRRNFRSDQWKVLVPVFPKVFTRFHFGTEIILPFTYVDPVRKEGTFGDVYQVTILKSHQEDPMRKHNGLLANAAIKELKASAASGEKGGKDDKAKKVFKAWEAEAQALEDTSRLKHKHIVTVKSIFTKGPRHYFMFQWADGGSLRDLYKGDLWPNVTARLVEEVTGQLGGLFSALSALHTYQKDGSSAQPGLLAVPGQNQGSYRHGDLKPENILIFKDATKVGYSQRHPIL
ncbi:hypothetical protein KVR01_012250 [Diaporthe batatas]|uniref:uncharacterized protein n=1 Tax=Diaporthe batatas TaxID=748121 RepID=UPI001D04A0EC|nr:uncharacterized protein KVR01_012250 [Diaporthe batatas]KAG8157978.1 hypothetical protein KVR01_012250 [Diaporthe batatas]